MKIRTATVCGAALSAVLMLPHADAAGPTTVKDIPGDANALNNQGGLIPGVPDGTATPVQQADLDILSLTFGVKKKGKDVTDLLVTLEYAAKPNVGSVVHRVTAGDAAGCTTFLIQYYPTGTGQKSSLRTCDASGALGYSDVPLADPAIDGNKLVWTIPMKVLGALPETKLKVGSTLTGLGAHNRVATAVTFPVVDQVRSEDSYKIGN